MQELCEGLVALVSGGFTNLHQKLFDLACSKLKQSTEVMQALVKVAVVWASELLEVTLPAKLKAHHLGSGLVA